MFKALGQVILLIAIVHMFGAATSAFEHALVAVFEAIEQNAQQLQ